MSNLAFRAAGIKRSQSDLRCSKSDVQLVIFSNVVPAGIKRPQESGRSRLSSPRSRPLLGHSAGATETLIINPKAGLQSRHIGLSSAIPAGNVTFHSNSSGDAFGRTVFLQHKEHCTDTACTVLAVSPACFSQQFGPLSLEPSDQNSTKPWQPMLTLQCQVMLSSRIIVIY